MSTTYAQKQAPAQKMGAPSAASVMDSSSQSKSLQRKADMANGVVQLAGGANAYDAGGPTVWHVHYSSHVRFSGGPTVYIKGRTYAQVIAALRFNYPDFATLCRDFPKSWNAVKKWLKKHL